MGAPRITEEEFNTVKLLSRTTKLTQEKIAEIIGRSVSAIGDIVSSETFGEYAQKRTENSRKYNANRGHKANEMCAQEAQQTPAPQVTEHRQTVVVQATWAMMQEMQKTNKLLELISNKLAFIVDELCGTGKEEG